MDSLWIEFRKSMPATMTDGQTETLFSADRDMMDFDLWEGMQKLARDLIESKAVMILKSKR